MEGIARVFLVHDGSIHIGFNDYHTTICTVSSLIDLLSDPFRFVERGRFSFEDTSPFANPNRRPLEEIEGVTLAYVTQDLTVTCQFHKLFQILFSEIKSGGTETLLSMRGMRNSDQFSDEKELFLKLFLLLSESGGQELSFDRHINVSLAEQTQLVQEIVNSSFAVRKPGSTVQQLAAVPVSEEDITTQILNRTDVPDNNSVVIPSHYILLTDYAETKGVTNATVRVWIRRNKLRSAIQDKRHRWWLDPEDTAVDLRAGRQMTKKNNGKKKLCVARGSSYAEVQRWIAGRKLFTENVRPFIRTAEEARFYEHGNYHEVCWDGESYLIIDINPDYYCKRLGKTNRELVLSGRSPIVPGSDQDTFRLHHVGQRRNSPLAIIPDSIHNKEKYSVFHQGAVDPNLHDDEFEERKRRFWAKYIELYDQHDSYRGIEYLNSKHKKDQR